MNRLEATFAALRAGGRKAFIPFITAGDPNIAATPAQARILLDAGADVLEIGFPYSDPIADGPVIQASYTRALANKLTLDAIFTATAGIHADAPNLPLVGMVSFALIHRRGVEIFLDQAKSSGFVGLIVPDLPLEECAALLSACDARQLSLVQLVTPTTPPDRAERIVATSRGFVYCVSVTGITGARAEIPPALLEQLAWLRTKTTLPLCVGFGVSRPEHVRLLRDHADGVIVGSALVRELDSSERLNALARSLSEALK